jgi:predicted peroxiredoxin
MATTIKTKGLVKPAQKRKPTKLQNLSNLMKEARELGAKLVKQKKLKPFHSFG